MRNLEEKDVMHKTLITNVTALWVLTLVPGLAFSAGDAAKGKEIYLQQCVACHGNGGKGDGPAAAALNPKPKNLTDKAVMAAMKDTQIFDVIKKGGPGVGKSPLMPPFGGSMKDDDIHNLVAFIRSLAK